MQKVTDAATELTQAAFGAFFYNVHDAGSGDAYMLYTLSGAPKEAFAQFPHPRATGIFAPTFHGEGSIRLDDVTQDPRFGQNPPFHGMPAGHLPVRSYLAVPVTWRPAEVLGGLFFGHPRAGPCSPSSTSGLPLGHRRLGLASRSRTSRLFVEAQDANRMKDEFLAVALARAAHAAQRHRRLRAAAARRHPRPARRSARGLETLERNAHWLTQIVEDVLDVSRIVTGKIRLDVQPVAAAADHRERGRHRAASGGRQGRAPAGHRRPAASVRSRATPIACSRWCGTC